ncbi:MAG: ATP-binding cassette domain-containing protein [Rhodospirillales bacterium]|nr:ATP-binding cassette domain-containing protein [Rhodospirillales bacterium]
MPLVEAEGLVKRYRLPRSAPWRPAPAIEAVAGVSFRIRRGRSLGIVGESGCGKSTLARLVMALERPDEGRIALLGADLAALSPRELRAHRRHLQMVFQDPYGSLDPRHKVGRIVAEPLRLEGAADRRARVAEALEAVGLKPADAAKYPHEFSGGQRQRIAIARALITRPALIVADEPVSALDVSVQAQVLNLMRALEAEQGVTYLFISHDLAVVQYVTAEVAVMYRGRIVESGPTAEVFAAPLHPYTSALKDAVPGLVPGRRRRRTPAPPADADAGGGGCPFAPRCPRAEARCRAEAPALRGVAPGREAACHFV